MRRRSVLAGLVVALGLMTAPAEAAMRTEHLIVQTKAGPVDFTVEVATTPEEQARGLMFRTSLPERRGMLFDFEHDGSVAFWMKNTLIPLDLLFIDDALTLRHVHPMAEPLSERHIGSPVPVRWVLEIIGGDAARLGIAVGDKVLRRP